MEKRLVARSTVKIIQFYIRCGVRVCIWNQLKCHVSSGNTSAFKLDWEEIYFGGTMISWRLFNFIIDINLLKTEEKKLDKIFRLITHSVPCVKLNSALIMYDKLEDGFFCQWMLLLFVRSLSWFHSICMVNYGFLFKDTGESFYSSKSLNETQEI